MTNRYFENTLWIFLLVSFCIGCATPSDLDHSPALSPAEELATFQLKPGYTIELVAAEPLVEDPILVQFERSRPALGRRNARLHERHRRHGRR